MKFTKQGRVALDVTATATFHGQWHVRFEVSDTGIGIQPERLDSIFQPFTQADGSNNPQVWWHGAGSQH